ncbi:hypothetical protein EYF80_021524 [Liparis tanakae]|uniref:Uncharacterized protein n=1 Tax=Liparis tanakae TaxID=230148 RepID=A0A4Z2HTK6_9TELE|nr:hypothetical protein EYF80_021524 [Liparis tanakae]
METPMPQERCSSPAAWLMPVYEQMIQPQISAAVIIKAVFGERCYRAQQRLGSWRRNRLSLRNGATLVEAKLMCEGFGYQRFLFGHPWRIS